MNKKTICILCVTALYSFLFYQQHVGINFLLFTLSILGCFFFMDQKAFQSKSVILLSLSSLFAATFTVIHGSSLSMWATIISLWSIPGAIINKRSSLLIDFLSACYTIMVSVGYMIVEIIESGKKGKGKGFLRLLKYLVPIVFVITFFFIYRAMNPLFEKLTQDIAEFISLGWVFFTLGGFYLAYSYFKQQRNKKVDLWEKNWLLNIDHDLVKTPKWNEGIAFSLLFIVLNLMLVAVNAMDINYLYLGEGMPSGITHKQFVHKGVGMLILSILLGISILLFFFRGTLNFSKNKYLIKGLAIVWVLQNTFMVISTSLRNTMYIDAALLTYKRIGVYFWLFLAFIGLLLTLYKLYKNKSVWFMTRHFITSMFVILVFSSAWDWDGIISDFNLKRAHQMEEISSLDKNYLLSLSEGNIAGLFAIKDLPGFEIDSVYSYQPDRHYNNKNWLDGKVYDFLNEDSEGDWRSYSLRRTRVREDIQRLHEAGALNSINLQGHWIQSLSPLYQLNHISELNLNDNYFNNNEKLAGINALQSLQKLSLNNNYISNLDTLSTNNNITHLSLHTNEIYNLKFLKKFPNLDSLELGNNKVKGLSSLPTLNHLTTLSLDGNPLTDVNDLTKLPALTHLSINNIIQNIGKIPKLQNLKSLSMSSSGNIVKYNMMNLSEMALLTHLDVSYCDFYSLTPLLNKDQTTKTPALISLVINNNGLGSLHGIEKMKHLVHLNAGNNAIRNLEEVRQLTELKQLVINNNQIVDLEFLTSIPQVEHLDLSNNASIQNFKALKALNQLSRLYLSGTGFKSLSQLNMDAPLQYLILEGCRVKDWSLLNQFKDLHSISVSFLKKEDVRAFKDLKKLKYLTITHAEDDVIELVKKTFPHIEVY